MDLAAEWAKLLRAEAAGYAQVALDNLQREFPSDVHHTMTGPGDFPFRPRARTPVFYGSLDWHSCVEMHWLLVRLLRTAGETVPASRIRRALRSQFSPVALAVEAEYIAGPGRWGQRPYGWGWALSLVREAWQWDDPEALKWAAAMAPLAEAVTGCFLDWLPKATYPVRYGVHSNSAFGLSRALGYARLRAAAGDPALLEAIVAKSLTWFGADMLYPGGWEPSGHDFLSPALTEAELMAQILPPGEFAGWLSIFLPGIVSGEPASLFMPAVVSDSSDGQIAHLHGLNASRAWCWRRIAESLPAGDPRVEPALAAARTHADAALPHVIGDDYMVEHWLACYAVLMLSLRRQEELLARCSYQPPGAPGGCGGSHRYSPGVIDSGPSTTMKKARAPSPATTSGMPASTNLGHQRVRRVRVSRAALRWAGYLTLKIILGAGGGNPASKQQDLTASVMHHTGGQWLVGISGSPS